MADIKVLKIGSTGFPTEHGTTDSITMDQYATTNGLTTVGPTGIQLTGAAVIKQAATPSVGDDLTNKTYVDSVAAGLDTKESVQVGTLLDLSGTYATTPSNGQFTAVDLTSGTIFDLGTHTLANGDRILVKNQTDAKQNGIYEVTDATTPTSATITRAADQDGSPASEVSSGNFTFVENGAGGLNGLNNTGWVVSGDGVLTLNTDNIDWVQFSAADATTAGPGIAKNGTEISTSVTNGLGDVTLGSSNTGEFVTVSSGATGTFTAVNTVIDGTVVDVLSSGAMSIESTGSTMDITSSGPNTITAAGINLAAGSSEIDLTTTGLVDVNGGTVTVDGTSSASVTSADVNVTSTNTLDIISSSNGAPMVVKTTGTADLNISTFSGQLDLTSGGLIDINATNAVTIDAGAASNLTTSSGALTLDGNGGVNIAGNASEVDVTTTGLVDINGATVDIDATTASLDGSTLVTIGGSTVGLTGTTIEVNGSTLVNIDSASIVADATADVVITAGTTGAVIAPVISLQGATGIAIETPIDKATLSTVPSGTVDQAIATVGYVNSVSAASDVLVTFTTEAATSVIAGDPVYIDSAGTVQKADSSVIATAKVAAMANEALGTSTAGDFTVSGKVTVVASQIEGATTFATVGAPVYLSETAGQYTQTAPSAANTVVYQVGISSGTLEFLIDKELVGINS